jgi:phosphate transport system permease protein
MAAIPADSARQRLNARRMRRARWRTVNDAVWRYVMGIGGIGVVAAILLIFIYLLYVVLPIFRAASLEQQAVYSVPGARESKPVFLALEEQAEVGLRIAQDGRLVFFAASDGKPLQETHVALKPGASHTSFAAGDLAQAILAAGASDGSALVFRHAYGVSYPNDKRVITPRVDYPLGTEPVTVDDTGQALDKLAIQSDDHQTSIVAVTRDKRVLLTNFTAEENLMGEKTVEKTSAVLPLNGGQITFLAMDLLQRLLYAAETDGSINYFDISQKAKPRLVQRVKAVGDGAELTSLRILAGGISLLVGDSKGGITQWFPVRDNEGNYTLRSVRGFREQTAAITDIVPEYFRKAFAAVDSSGVLGLYHTTAHRTLKLEKLGDQAMRQAAFAPRANALLFEDANSQIHLIRMHNEHPEVSWNALWGKVWYESREGPEWTWQSSSASSNFEPKFSLTPLAFGTLKASFYAMIFSLPLAVLGAIYAGYFMSPSMRNYVKPTIEIMAALPTVILGFLAGLWLAPLIEEKLPGIFLLMVLFPLAILICSYLWSLLPSAIRHRLPEGWEAILLVPVILLTAALALSLSAPIEAALFDGNMPQWITKTFGVPYDQRNSLVVGIVMGFAVVPTIFSISEDAIFNVPKQLTAGSLALGATPWQTLVRVVLLTASPGIFAAVMIGLGRAVGETMIVVMATGNTPIVDWNIFQGFRALSANIAVEMPESEVGSTHYRILSLAALVLFIFTFIFNTLAEIVRQRLRKKYGSL